MMLGSLVCLRVKEGSETCEFEKGVASIKRLRTSSLEVTWPDIYSIDVTFNCLKH